MNHIAIIGQGTYSTLFSSQNIPVNVYPPWMEMKDIHEANLIVFTGGSDISPQYYNHKPIPQAQKSSEDRDANEMSVFHKAVAHGIPMLGICRGAQLLNVMNGGWLIQDCDGHTNNHSIRSRMSNFDKIQVTSTHHQMMVPGAGHVMEAWAEGLSTYYAYDDSHGKPHFSVTDEGVIKEPEILYYPNSQSLCVQFHPEYMEIGTPGRRYFLALMFKYIWEAGK